MRAPNRPPDLVDFPSGRSAAGRYSPLSEIRRHWAVFLVLAVVLALWGLCDVSRRAIVDPAHPARHMTDFTVYTEAGAAFFDGRAPYEVANLRGWKYLYPPLFAMLVAPLHAASGPVQAGVWFIVSVALAFGCYVECRRLIDFVSRADTAGAGSETGIPPWLLLTSLTAVAFPALNCLQRGQMGIALLYGLLLGFRLALSGGSHLAWIAAGLVLALPINLKVTPALPALAAIAGLFVAGASAVSSARGTAAHSARSTAAAFTPSRSGWMSFGLLVGCLMFFQLIPAALVGNSANHTHLQTWYSKVGRRFNDVRADDFGENVATFRNQSLQNAAYRGGNWFARGFLGGPDDLHMDVTKASMPMDTPAVSRTISIVRGLALLALAAVIFSAGRRRDPLLLGVAFGLSCVATLVVSPVSRGHYFVFWVPAVVLLPWWLCRCGRSRAALVNAVVPAVLTILHYVALDYAGRAGLLGLGTTLWYFAACVQVCTIRPLAQVPAVRAQPAPPLSRAA